MATTRFRAANYTNIETHMLIDLVTEFISIIENKNSDATTWRKKDEAWEQLAARYNARTLKKRNPKELRMKYESLKKHARKRGAKISLDGPMAAAELSIVNVPTATSAAASLVRVQTEATSATLNYDTLIKEQELLRQTYLAEGEKIKLEQEKVKLEQEKVKLEQENFKLKRLKDGTL